VIRETYKGRRLVARTGQQHGRVDVTCNGELAHWQTGRDLAAALVPVRAQIDAIDAEPVNGDKWGAHWYAPGTYEMCPEGIHPQAIGGQCQHFTCIRKRQPATAGGSTR
jgi:hypothetical protein